MIEKPGTPKGNRTPVTAVKGRDSMLFEHFRVGNPDDNLRPHNSYAFLGALAVYEEMLFCEARRLVTTDGQRRMGGP